MRNKLFIYFFIALYNMSFSQELIIGEERIEPGIVFIFEGAIKDHVMPMGCTWLKMRLIFILKQE